MHPRSVWLHHHFGEISLPKRGLVRKTVKLMTKHAESQHFAKLGHYSGIWSNHLSCCPHLVIWQTRWWATDPFQNCKASFPAGQFAHLTVGCSLFQTACSLSRTCLKWSIGRVGCRISKKKCRLPSQWHHACSCRLLGPWAIGETFVEPSSYGRWHSPQLATLDKWFQLYKHSLLVLWHVNCRSCEETVCTRQVPACAASTPSFEQQPPLVEHMCSAEKRICELGKWSSTDTLLIAMSSLCFRYCSPSMTSILGFYVPKLRFDYETCRSGGTPH